MPTPEVVLVGEAMACFTTSDASLVDAVQLARSFGGAEANVAVGLSRLGVATALVSVVGDDPLGHGILRALRAEGVATDLIRRDPGHQTGLMVKEVRAPDDVRVFFYRSASAAAALGPGSLLGADAIAGRMHVTGITLAVGPGMAEAALDLARRVHGAGGSVSFDPNIRLKVTTAAEAARRTRSILPVVDDLLLSESEARAITGETSLEATIAALERLPPRRIVLRRGALGAIGLIDGERVEVPATASRPVVDTVGAGDSSTAGYLFGQLRGLGFEESLRVAAWTSGEVVGRLGDHAGAPWRADFDAWHGGTVLVDR